MATTELEPRGPATPTGVRTDPQIDDVIDALRDQYESVAEEAEKRDQDRRACQVPLTVAFEEKTSEGVRRRTVEVVTHDISRGGLSFIFRSYVHLGTVVRTRFMGLANAPEIIGTVRSCIHICGGMHRVGVQFEQRVEEQC